MKKTITQEELKALLKYDPETGKFYRRTNVGGAKIGDEAGCIKRDGYCFIRINGKKYNRSRLAWLYAHGYFPENQVDHINRDRADDRISNLREVTNQCNQRNAGQLSNNTSGVKGVCWHKGYKKWTVQIMIDYKSYHLGYFTDKVEAAAYRLAAEQCFDWGDCNTNSSARAYLACKGVIPSLCK